MKLFIYHYQPFHCQLSTNPGGLAQLARASALHAEGHRFDSDILHKKANEQRVMNNEQLFIVGSSGKKLFLK